MQGYYKNPDATTKAIDPEGWFDTGDLGKITPRGDLIITGRAKDTIVLTNAQRSGFESDNYTSRVAAWDPLVDGELPGNPVAIIDGANEVTVTDTDLTGSTFDSSAVASVPGAPAPPAVLLLAFGATFLLRSHFGRRSA